MINMRDLRALGYCAIGARRVCRASNIDFKKLTTEGLTIEEIVEKAPRKYREEIVEAYGEREGWEVKAADK